MKKQKKDKRRQSTQQLMGIQKITDYCIDVYKRQPFITARSSPR